MKIDEDAASAASWSATDIAGTRETLHDLNHAHACNQTHHYTVDEAAGTVTFDTTYADPARMSEHTVYNYIIETASGCRRWIWADDAFENTVTLRRCD